MSSEITANDLSARLRAAMDPILQPAGFELPGRGPFFLVHRCGAITVRGLIQHDARGFRRPWGSRFTLELETVPGAEHAALQREGQRSGWRHRLVHLLDDVQAELIRERNAAVLKSLPGRREGDVSFPQWATALHAPQFLGWDQWFHYLTLRDIDAWGKLLAPQMNAVVDRLIGTGRG